MTKRRDWPLVSVCITSFNRLQYLQKTLDSFQNCCTYPNLEYVIVDNCSEYEVVEFIQSLDYLDHGMKHTDISDPEKELLCLVCNKP